MTTKTPPAAVPATPAPPSVSPHRWPPAWSYCVSARRLATPSECACLLREWLCAAECLSEYDKLIVCMRVIEGIEFLRSWVTASVREWVSEWVSECECVNTWELMLAACMYASDWTYRVFEELREWVTASVSEWVSLSVLVYCVNDCVLLNVWVSMISWLYVCEWLNV